MEEEKRKTTEDLIKILTDKIISNSKDAKWAKDMLSKLASFYQMDKLVDVSLRDIKESIDLGACEIHKVKDGYVFVAKGGMETHVSIRLQRTCAMFETIFELNNKEDKTEDEQSLYDSFSTAVAYIMQCPIFSSLDERALFQNATSIISTFNEFCNENYTHAESVEESEQDIKENIQAEQMANALETLANAPLPPED